MTKPLDKHAQSILDELGFNPDDCLWDCRGTWVMLHKYIELAGVQKGITMDSLDVIESNAEKGIAVIKCVASKGDIKVTSFGEVNPKNNRNSYPMAMAEKRAIDRAYLKLLGLHGFIYSEEDMKLTDEEKEELPKKKSKRIVSPDRDYIIFDEDENEIARYNSFQSYAKAIQEAHLNEANVKEIRKHIDWIKSPECVYEEKAKESALKLITTTRTQHIIEGENNAV